MNDYYAPRKRGKLPRELAEFEVMSEIGAWMMREMQGQKDMLRKMFDELQPLFAGRYPHEKFLSHLCFDTMEPKEIASDEPAHLLDSKKL